MMQLFPFDLGNVALASSKAAQVLIPLAFFLGLRRLAIHEKAGAAWAARSISAIGHKRTSAALRSRVQSAIERTAGFLSWKIGCDLGYFIVTGQNVLAAFTPAGLIPYTIGQYLVYRWFGQKVLLSGMRSPLAAETYQIPTLKRRRPFTRFLAHFFHEDMNATSPHVPLRRVALKPFADYLGIFVAWSLYSMGIFWVQSQEVNWEPFIRFPHAQMIGFYLGGLLAFTWGYSLGDIGIRRLSTYLSRQEGPTKYRTNVLASSRGLAWRIRHFRESYGIGLRHFGAVVTGILFVLILTPAIQSFVSWVAQEVSVSVFEMGNGPLLPSGSLEQIGPDTASLTTLPPFDESETAFLKIQQESP